MTDQIPADKVRKLAARFRQQMEPHTPAAECEVWECAAEAVEALLPPPSLPTLADMTEEERSECQWMQADVANLNTRYVILEPRDPNGSAVMMAQSGRVVWFRPHRVTPRPDLPRMTWPNLPAANDTSLPHAIKRWVLDAEGSPVVWTAPGGRVMIQRIEPGDLTPDQARTFALNILAAAAYSEGTNHD